jgi:hypothetical protein
MAWPSSAGAGDGGSPGFVERSENEHLDFDAAPLISARGLQLPRQISFDKWVGIGRQLSGICSSTAWCLGDWLVYGEAAFNGRYRDAIEMTSLHYQTLRNYAWVARRFSLSRRRVTLSFGHHTEVAALPESEQEYWLRKAEELAWTVKRLRHEVRTSLRERSTGDNGEVSLASDPSLIDDDLKQDTVMLKVPIPADHLKSFHTVASTLGLDVETWAALVLTKAAIYQDAVVVTD